MQPDDYHFQRDPGGLIEARLTKDEAEALASYRAAREQMKGDVKNLVIVLPVGQGAPIDPDVIGDIARRAAIDAVKREVSA